MDWTIWDGIVIIFFVAQIALIIWIVLLALQIKNGPVAAMLGRVRPIIASGKAIAAGGQEEFGQNRARVMATVAEAQALIAMLRRDNVANLNAAMPINYQSLRGALATVQMVRGGWKQIQRARKKTANPPGPTKAAKRQPVTIADRMGLVPPIVKKAAPLIRVAKVALKVRKEMQQRTGRAVE